MIQITDSAISKVKGSNRIIGKLMTEFNKGQKAIENWLAAKDVRLTTPAAVAIIKEESGLDDSEILEDTEKTSEVVTNGAAKIGS